MITLAERHRKSLGWGSGKEFRVNMPEGIGGVSWN